MTTMAWYGAFFILTAGQGAETSPAEQVSIAEAMAPSLVKVEYTLQYDQGQPPSAAGWARRCPNCGEFHIEDGSDRVADERPLEMGGFLISERQVIAPDVVIHPRFVKGVSVRFRDQTRPARITGYGRDQKAVLLAMDAPLTGAKPLTFEPAAPPYLAVTYTPENATWTIGVQPLASRLSVSEAGWKFRAAPGQCLLVSGAGKPVGLAFADELPLDDSWMGSPARMATMEADALKKALQAVEERCAQGLPQVTLHFRSPKTGSESRWGYRRYGGGDQDETATRRDVLGLLIDDRTVLVLAELKPQHTARLERILVRFGQKEPVPARFTATLADFGCLVAALEKPLPGAMPTAKGDLLAFRNRLLMSAQATVKGEQRTAYYQHARIAGFESGWRGRPYPSLASSAENMFLFTEQAELLAVPVSRRKKVTVREEWESGQAVLTPVAYLAAVLANLPHNIDPNNVPLSQEQENRLAWIGVELQPLDQNLARLNKVADMTSDGQTGALVTYVYPDSPAAKAGIEAGQVLLRLHVKGHPRPLEVRMENDRSGTEFPWEQLGSGEVPAEVLEQLPAPWPPAENSFVQALTELGFGTRYTADFWHDGKLVSREFEVVESPRHYDSAPRFKSEAMGLTVRDLTYEVRRYFQVAAGEPGVVISKLEPGSKAAVAGLLPYERITHVNDQPVGSVKDFERLAASGGEIRLSVKRQTQGRIVKLTLPEKK